MWEADGERRKRESVREREREIERKRRERDDRLRALVPCPLEAAAHAAPPNFPLHPHNARVSKHERAFRCGREREAREREQVKSPSSWDRALSQPQRMQPSPALMCIQACE